MWLHLSDREKNRASGCIQRENRGLWAATRLDAVAGECVSRQWYDAVPGDG